LTGRPPKEAFLLTRAWAREGACSRLHTGIQQYRTRGPSGPFAVSGPSFFHSSGQIVTT